MSKIKLLVVAPYEGLKELVQSLSDEYTQFEIHTVVANLEQGAQAALKGVQESSQIILSRGGTAEMIERSVSVPVVRIDISGYDYMRIITLASGFSGKSAMIGYRSITSGAQAIKNLMQSSIDIFTINSSEELAQLLNQLREENYQVIIGDVVTQEKAREMGFTAILLTSGEESVRKAFEEAQKIFGYLVEYQSKLNLLEQALSNIPQYYTILDAKGHAVETKLPAEQQKALLQNLSDSLNQVLQVGKWQFLLKCENIFWEISASRIADENLNLYVVFFLSQRPAKKEEIAGVSVSNPKNPSDFSVSILGRNSIYLKEVYAKALKFGNLHLPVLITGEVGTGKDALAVLIHSFSNRNASFLTLDGEKANRASVESVIEMIRSDHSLTFYIRMASKLSEENQQLLTPLLSEPGFFEKHLVLSSFNEPPETATTGCFSKTLIRLLGEYRIHLPSLRERPGDMKDLASNYMNEANFKYGKQVVTIEEDALQLLTEFKWTTNLNQLRRIIFQLILLSDGPTIRAEAVSEALKEEPAANGIGDSFSSCKTLDEIIDNVIRRTIQMENGNLSNVSERLGISRSTIWRRMKQKPNILS
ncbi:sigma-54-dependent transcriptional regulator [Caproiciproducens sp. NJN-50]|uniref:sigma-54-dependent transcriptional regulator n=1 Tax=Acutalibacteraceae TaxID=3082771 RepID=UPI000FFE2E8E|nr:MULTISPECIES: sigma-54-dependent transcriptional regulator [Acutalibacteraceae]QAT50119.1 sigma-54-dependent transcriptional regulator [Caproiciproducens sp. NJN-50]